MTKVIIGLVAMLMVSINVVATPMFGWERLTSAQVTALRGSVDTTVVATGQFRAGGNTSPEIRVQNGEMNLSQPHSTADLIWDTEGGVNSISAGFGTPELAGFFRLTGTGSDGSSGSADTLPTQWFNQVLITYESSLTTSSINGTLNGESFSLSTDYSTFESEDRFDAILFSWYIPHGTAPSFDMSASMSMTTPLPELVGDQFMSDIQLIQNFQVVPEPTTFGLFGIGFLVLGIKKIRRKLILN